ncbi:hypothetical protein ACFU5Y_07790 [Streptomyces gardneri]|uniref:hypothetical protein n=1 Tax=Streptomyces gardneri TaxID=66892 RepID=UPI0036BE6546
MHPYLPSTSPDEQPPPWSAAEAQHRDPLRRAVRRVQRTFLAVNAPPLAVAVLLFPSTGIPSVRVAGHLTIGLAWGILQCGLLVASAYWYERTFARTCDPLVTSLTYDTPGSGSGTTRARHFADRCGW